MLGLPSAGLIGYGLAWLGYFDFGSGHTVPWYSCNFLSVLKHSYCVLAGRIVMALSGLNYRLLSRKCFTWCLAGRKVMLPSGLDSSLLSYTVLDDDREEDIRLGEAP